MGAQFWARHPDYELQHARFDMCLTRSADGRQYAVLAQSVLPPEPSRGPRAPVSIGPETTVRSFVATVEILGGTRGPPRVPSCSLLDEMTPAAARGGHAHHRRWRGRDQTPAKVFLDHPRQSKLAWAEEERRVAMRVIGRDPQRAGRRSCAHCVVSSSRRPQQVKQIRISVSRRGSSRRQLERRKQQCR